MFRHFPFRFLRVLLWAIQGVRPPRTSFEFLEFCIHVIYPLTFLFPFLFQNCFTSFLSGCWFELVHSPPTCWYNFLSLFWNFPFRLYSFTHSWYLLRIPSVANIFWFISWSCIVRLSAVLFWSFHPSILMCAFPYLSPFAYRIFLLAFLT